MRVFVAVAESGSFSAAGRKLSMTQPGVSKQVKALENHFGVRLVEWRRQRARLTPAGASLHEAACDVLTRVADVEMLMREHRDGHAGSLSIGAGITFGTYVLPEIVACFRRTVPNADVRLHPVPGSKLAAGVRSGTFDFGIGFDVDGAAGLVSEELCSTQWVLFVAGGHPLLDRLPPQPDELVAYTFLIGGRDSPSSTLRMRLLEDRGIRPRQIVETGHPEATKRIVANGTDIGMLTVESLAHELQSGELVALPGHEFPTTVKLYWRTSGYMSSLMRAYHIHLRQALALSSPLPRDRTS